MFSGNKVARLQRLISKEYCFLNFFYSIWQICFSNPVLCVWVYDSNEQLSFYHFYVIQYHPRTYMCYYTSIESAEITYLYCCQLKHVETIFTEHSVIDSCGNWWYNSISSFSCYSLLLSARYYGHVPVLCGHFRDFPFM